MAADLRRLLGDLVRPLQSHVARLRTAGKGPPSCEVPQSGDRRVAGNRKQAFCMLPLSTLRRHLIESRLMRRSLIFYSS
jgi:hypothetical protein